MKIKPKEEDGSCLVDAIQQLKTVQLKSGMPKKEATQYNVINNQLQKMLVKCKETQRFASSSSSNLIIL